jgi:hypothetical protein
VTGLEWVLAALAIVVLMGICGIVALILIVRAVSRRIRRNPAVGGAVLRTRARVSRGPQRTILSLRVRLRQSLDSGKAAVDLAAHGGGPRGELPRLYRRIEQEGVAMDLQLQLMESEADPAVLAADLPAATVRVEQVVALVRRLRAAVASGLAGLTDDTLTTLSTEMDREVAALHAGVEELRALNRRDAVDAPTRQPSADRLHGSTYDIRENRGTPS